MMSYNNIINRALRATFASIAVYLTSGCASTCKIINLADAATDVAQDACVMVIPPRTRSELQITSVTTTYRELAKAAIIKGYAVRPCKTQDLRRTQPETGSSPSQDNHQG